MKSYPRGMNTFGPDESCTHSPMLGDSSRGGVAPNALSAGTIVAPLMPLAIASATYCASRAFAPESYDRDTVEAWTLWTETVVIQVNSGCRLITSMTTLLHSVKGAARCAYVRIATQKRYRPVSFRPQEGLGIRRGLA